MWIKNYINLTRYSLLAKTSYFKEISSLSDKIMYIGLYPLGYIKYIKQKNQ